MSHVDWLTIVGRREAGGDDWTVNHAYMTAVDWLMDVYPAFERDFGNPMHWQIVKPRAPYSFARRSEDNTRTLYVHPLSAHFTLEVSGTHCQTIAPHIHTVMEAFSPFLSRLDVATDMENDETPSGFVACAAPTALKTRSDMESPTGRTVYLGSRSSDRFCRVYRYNPPHPRSHLLRAEFQLKNDYAKRAGEAIAQGEAVNGIAAELGRVFGFQHPAWQPQAEPVKLKVQSHAQSGNTVFWLTTTVAPLMRRLKREGKLDVEAWFAEYVMNVE